MIPCTSNRVSGAARLSLDSLMSADAQPDVLDVRFPTRRILAIIGDKWTTVVLYCLSIREHRRFNELQKQIPDISKKMLIQTLRNLERDGLLERTVYQQVPPKTEYRLTDSRSQTEGADRLALRMGHEQSRVHRWHHQGPSREGQDLKLRPSGYEPHESMPGVQIGAAPQ